MIFDEMIELEKLIFLKGAGGNGKPIHEYTASGNPLSFQTNIAKPLKSLLIPWTPSQSGSGDPSPENVRPISGVSGVTVWRTGVNVWDEQTEIGALSTSTGEKIQGNKQIRTKNYVPVVSGAEYNVVTHSAGSTYGLWTLFYDKDKNLISEGLPSGNSQSQNARRLDNGYKLTIPNNCAYIRWYFQISYGTTYGNDVSINYSSSETSYYPYTGTTIPVTFPALGRNLFDQTYYSDADNYTTLQSYYYYTEPIYLKPNTQYTLSPSSTESVGIGKYYVLYVNPSADNPNALDLSGNTSYPVENGTPKTKKFTTGATGTIRFGTYKQNLDSFMYVDWQLEEGSTATAYEPYTSTVYGGSLDLTTGVLTVGFGFDSFKWSTFGEKTTLGDYQRGSHSLSSPCINNNKAKCNIAPYISDYSSDSLHFYCNGTQQKGWIFLPVDTDGNTEITFAYELATPYTVQLTPTQIISALVGDNVIWSDTNGSNTAVYLKRG